MPRTDWTRKFAEIGQAEIDRANDEQKIDTAQDDIVEGFLPETVVTDQKMENEDDVAELFGSFDEAPEPEMFDISSRQHSPKRRIGEDEMEDASQDKKHKPRSQTISYRTDEESTGSQMDDASIGMLNDVDRKILSAFILGVDITEVYSPERVARVAKKFGLVSGSSMDLTNGWV